MPSFTGPLPVHRGDGRRSGGLALASQDCFTSEAFSPRTVLTENICRCVQQTLQHFTTKMPFLTTSRITFSCLASVAPQADSFWLGHLVTDDVVIADIGGQALDILLHGPESAHKNSIVKTFIHTSIPKHILCTLLKKKKKKKKALNLPNMMPSFTGPLPVHRGDGRRSGSLALDSQDCSTSEAFPPRTVLTENICRCVQQILQHFTTKMPVLTTSRITFSCLASVAPQADCWWFGTARALPSLHVLPDTTDMCRYKRQGLYQRGSTHTLAVENLPTLARSQGQTSARRHEFVRNASVAAPQKPVHPTRPKQWETGYETVGGKCPNDCGW